MTEILLIRHGETAWNAERRLQGFLDIGLNAEGQRQATLLALALQGDPLDAVIASDLQRAVDTARPIAAAHGLSLETDPALRERCFGAFEGLLYDEIGHHFPQAYQEWKAREVDARYPPGAQMAETLREFSVRAVAAVMRHAARHPDGRIAIVTHGGVLDCIFREVHEIGLDKPRDFEIRNTALNRLHWDGQRLHIDDWGRLDHLAQPARDELA